MDRGRILYRIYIWSTLLNLPAMYAVDVSSVPFRNVIGSSVATDETKYRMGKERNVMLVLPVMQGSDDPSDPGLQFWYTKPPVTFVVEEDGMYEEKSRLPSTAPTTSTQRYTEADITTFDIITTESPLIDNDNSGTRLGTENPSTIPSPPKKTQNFANRTNYRPSNHQDIHVSFVKNKIESSTSLHSTIPQDIHVSFVKNKIEPSTILHSTSQVSVKNKMEPSTSLYSTSQHIHVPVVKNKIEPSTFLYSSTSQPNLQIVSAEPKWKSDIHKLIEYDKLKFQKPKPRPEISTVLPSSTRIQFYSDFIPIEMGQRKPSLQKVTLEKMTNKPLTAGLRFPVVEKDAQYDSLKIYDMLQRESLKPASISKHDDAERIPSSDREFFDVLREMALPTDSLFRERTTSMISAKTPSMRATDQWVFTYGPEELSTLPIGLTEPTTTEESPSTTSQQPLISLPQTTTSDDTFADDFRKMLIALGILKGNETTTTTESNELWVDPESFTTDPLSYSKFKKIPVIEELPAIRKDMQSLLNSFGLLPKMDDGENLTPIRVTRQSRELRSDSFSRDAGTNKPKINLHTIFSEEKTPKSKKISNSKKSTKKKFNTPLSFLRGFNNRSNRRTQLFTVFTPLSPLKKTRKIPKSKKTIPRSTTIKPNSADNSSVSYEDLANSFGGGETAKRDTPDEDLTTTPNGLYFLVDWNWFLRTGDDDDKKPIRLKFSPHVGDPKRFIPIDFP